RQPWSASPSPGHQPWTCIRRRGGADRRRLGRKAGRRRITSGSSAKSQSLLDRMKRVAVDGKFAIEREAFQVVRYVVGAVRIVGMGAHQLERLPGPVLVEA